jgi:hypothetical protein
MALWFILLGFLIALVFAGILGVGSPDFWARSVIAVLVGAVTIFFVHRRQAFQPMFGGTLGNVEPLIARVIEILVYAIAFFFFFWGFVNNIDMFMPEWVLRPAMWATIAIFLTVAFFCWLYAQRLSGHRKDIALSAAVGSLVVLADLSVHYMALRYSWIYAGGFYHLVPLVLAFIAARIFADRRLDPYLDATEEERRALWRLHLLAWVAQPSWWELLKHGMRRAIRLPD